MKNLLTKEELKEALRRYDIIFKDNYIFNTIEKTLEKLGFEFLGYIKPFDLSIHLPVNMILPVFKDKDITVTNDVEMTEYIGDMYLVASIQIYNKKPDTCCNAENDYKGEVDTIIFIDDVRGIRTYLPGDHLLFKYMHSHLHKITFSSKESIKEIFGEGLYKFCTGDTFYNITGFDISLYDREFFEEMLELYFLSIRNLVRTESIEGVPYIKFYEKRDFLEMKKAKPSYFRNKFLKLLQNSSESILIEKNKIKILGNCEEKNLVSFEGDLYFGEFFSSKFQEGMRKILEEGKIPLFIDINKNKHYLYLDKRVRILSNRENKKINEKEMTEIFKKYKTLYYEIFK